jgi:hypothetical protein
MKGGMVEKTIYFPFKGAQRKSLSSFFCVSPSQDKCLKILEIHSSSRAFKGTIFQKKNVMKLSIGTMYEVCMKTNRTSEIKKSSSR